LTCHYTAVYADVESVNGRVAPLNMALNPIQQEVNGVQFWLPGNGIGSIIFGVLHGFWQPHYLILLQSGSPFFMLFVAMAASNSSGPNDPPSHSSISLCCLCFLFPMASSKLA